ncbi:hypothetical protein FHU30_006764 [Actinomadura rupiterrae]|nr:hypothetical protein [Actinomadura rupiterrae]
MAGTAAPPAETNDAVVRVALRARQRMVAVRIRPNRCRE